MSSFLSFIGDSENPYAISAKIECWVMIFCLTPLPLCSSCNIRLSVWPVGEIKVLPPLIIMYFPFNAVTVHIGGFTNHFSCSVNSSHDEAWITL